MTISSKEKRLDVIEIMMTPKEWAIRSLDETQRTGGENPKTKQELLDISRRISAAFDALSKQAEEKHPGNKPEDRQARTRLERELHLEYHALKKLIGKVNEETERRAALAGLDAALKISTLQTIILQDAFGRTARKAAEWIEDFKTEDKDDEENRQVMLDELTAYMDVDFSEKFSDSLPLGNIRIRFPTVIENWVKAAVFLIEDLYRHQSAVKVVQDKFFDGHPVLFPKPEAGLTRSIHAVEDAVQAFNQYLDVRGKLFKVEWDDEDEHQDGLTSAIPGEREGLLKIDLERIAGNAGRGAKNLAKEWAKDAKAEAIYDYRQRGGDEEAAAEELAISKGWI
jgi:hypothetical protein